MVLVKTQVSDSLINKALFPSTNQICPEFFVQRGCKSKYKGSQSKSLFVAGTIFLIICLLDLFYYNEI